VAEHRPDVPTPRVLCETPEWIFMTFQPGIALPALSADVDTTPARKECGAVFAGLHMIICDRFGYIGDRPNGPTWPAAYRVMIEALLDDARRFDVALPVTPAAIGAAVDAQRDGLATVTTPALLHFDLWDGNVLATVRDGAAHLSGLVDASGGCTAIPSSTSAHRP
jgi:hypothetical protein